MKKFLSTRFLSLWETINTSLWFVPSTMAIASIILSIVTTFIDEKTGKNANRAMMDFMSLWEPEGARSILSTIATSMITIIGVVFSITIVAMALASSQFGPRLLRNFMKDKGHQFVLGTFVATYLYCLLILRLVRTGGDNVFVPSISVTTAIGLSLASVAVLIYFIHHVCKSIRADEIVKGVYNDLLADMDRLFPRELGEGPDRLEKKESKGFDEYAFEFSLRIRASKDGYVRAIDGEELIKIAKEHDLLIKLEHQPGDFVVNNTDLALVKFRSAMDAEVKQKLEDCLILGSLRSPEQDPVFAIHQLVEVAVRSLSPGINDPFTAMACINRLASALSRLARKDFPSPFRYDDEGTLRVIVQALTFNDLLCASFDQIRRFGKTHVAVTVRLLEALTMIAEQSPDENCKEAIIRQAHMIHRNGLDATAEENDRQVIEDHFQALMERCSHRR